MTTYPGAWPGDAYTQYRIEAEQDRQADERNRRRLSEIRNRADLAARRLDDAAKKPSSVQTRDARGAEVLSVDFEQRIISVIAVPWGQPATVVWRNDVWSEVFDRGAFDELRTLTRTVRVNRGHDKSRTVGKIVKADPQDPRGLITDIRIAPTVLGDETLALADEDMLSASVGFTVPRGGEHADTRTRTRRIRNALLDHLALVESPAYAGAKVLAVRSTASATLQDFVNDPILQWAQQRVARGR